MEVVGAVASVISVVSFAGELTQGIQKLYIFWSNIKDAPASIQRIADRLSTLRELVTDIASEEQKLPPNDLLAKILFQGQAVIKELTATVHALDYGLQSKRVAVRKWSALKKVFKSANIADYEQNLARLETQLLLALQIQQTRLGRIIYERMVQRDVAIDANTTARELTYTSGTAQICAGPTSSPRNLQDFSHINNAYTRDNPVIISGCGSSSTRSQILSETILWTKRVCFDHTSILSSTLGSLRIRSQKISWQLVAPDSEAVFPEQNESEDRVSCIFMPAPWLQTLGLKRALHMSVDQPSAGPWKPTMTIYNTVPENAPIFDLCARGDVDGVRDLLLGGSASIHDMDPDGFTPIHYAVDYAKPQMYRFLVNAGAQQTLLVPKMRRHDRLDHPLQSMMFHWRQGRANLDKTMTAIRTFSRLVDFEVEASGWKLLMIWAFAYDSRFDKRGTAEMDLLRWFLQFFIADITANVNSRPCKMLLLQLLKWPEAFDLFFQQVVTHNVDEVGPLREYTILQQAVAAGCDYSTVLKHRPDFHVVRLDYSMSKKPETPTSLAMYNAMEFGKWRTTLERMNIDIEAFLDDELQQDPLRIDGWTKDTLRQLFKYKIDPSLKAPLTNYDDFCPIHYCAGRCNSSHWWFAGIKVQPYWMLMLEMFKSGISAQQIHENGLPQRDEAIGEGRNTDANQMMVLGHPQAVMALRDSKLASQIKKDLANCEEEVSNSFFRYRKGNVFCMNCWLFYEKTGKALGKEQRRLEQENREVDAEYSPFFLHASGDGPGAASKPKKYTRSMSEYGDTDMEAAFERILCGQRGASGSLINYF